jgi:hypothetical protein
MEGFSETYCAECALYSLEIAVQPGTDMDGRFRAFDLETNEYIWLNGWLWTFHAI